MPTVTPADDEKRPHLAYTARWRRFHALVFPLRTLLLSPIILVASSRPTRCDEVRDHLHHGHRYESACEDRRLESAFCDERGDDGAEIHGQGCSPILWGLGNFRADQVISTSGFIASRSLSHA